MGNREQYRVFYQYQFQNVYMQNKDKVGIKVSQYKGVFNYEIQ